jgi:hypothetical protein
MQCNNRPRHLAARSATSYRLASHGDIAMSTYRPSPMSGTASPAAVRRPAKCRVDGEGRWQQASATLGGYGMRGPLQT